MESLWEEYSVNRYMKRIAVVLVAALLLLSVCAMAEGVISTTVVMRVSRMTQNAVVNAGEDLSMEVNIDGVEPASYQWYFEDVAIGGANQKAYSIVNAQVKNSGVYRMDAFDAEGRMLVSMDITARVIDDTIPQSGDGSMPVEIAVATFVLAAAVMMLALRRKVRI